MLEINHGSNNPLARIKHKDIILLVSEYILKL
nr:hypothetical protein CJLB15_00020 [Campylobacter phage CJLB-15]